MPSNLYAIVSSGVNISFGVDGPIAPIGIYQSRSLSCGVPSCCVSDATRYARLVALQRAMLANRAGMMRLIEVRREGGGSQ